MRARLVVSGNIQGVGYRAFVKLVARNLNIKGLVRNLQDGTVEIFCETDENTLERFIETIERRGDPLDVYAMNVSKIEKYPEGDENYVGPPGEFDVFDIDYAMEIDAAHRETIERTEIGTLVLQKGFKDMKTEMSTGFKDLKTEMSTGFKDLKTEMSTGFKGLGEKVGSMHQDVNVRFDRLDAAYGRFGEKLDSLAATIEELKDDFKLLVHHFIDKRKRRK